MGTIGRHLTFRGSLQRSDEMSVKACWLGIPTVLVAHFVLNFHHYLADSLIWKRRRVGSSNAEIPRQAEAPELIDARQYWALFSGGLCVKFLATREKRHRKFSLSLVWI
jgi:hypothetical protein